MDDKWEQQITKTTIGAKAYFIAKYIFCGILFWAYLSTGYAVARKGKVGLFLGLVMLLMFILYKDIMIPIRSNKNELGEYTNIIAEIVGIIAAVFFYFYIGNFFTVLK